MTARREIIVHVYRELPPVVEFPIGMEIPEMMRFVDAVENWVEGTTVLTAQGYAVVVCDHRDVDQMELTL